MDLIDRMREASGNVQSDGLLVDFLYILMRDHLPCGKLERIMLDVETLKKEKDTVFSNGWLALYSMDVAKRLKGE